MDSTIRRRGVAARLAGATDSAITAARRRAGRPLTRLQMRLRRVAAEPEVDDVGYHLEMMGFGDDFAAPAGARKLIGKLSDERPLAT